MAVLQRWRSAAALRGILQFRDRSPGHHSSLSAPAPCRAAAPTPGCTSMCVSPPATLTLARCLQRMKRSQLTARRLGAALSACPPVTAGPGCTVCGMHPACRTQRHHAGLLSWRGHVHLELLTVRAMRCGVAACPPADCKPRNSWHILGHLLPIPTLQWLLGNAAEPYLRERQWDVVAGSHHLQQMCGPPGIKCSEPSVGVWHRVVQLDLFCRCVDSRQLSEIQFCSATTL